MPAPDDRMPALTITRSASRSHTCASQSHAAPHNHTQRLTITRSASRSHTCASRSHAEPHDHIPAPHNHTQRLTITCVSTRPKSSRAWDASYFGIHECKFPGKVRVCFTDLYRILNETLET